MPKKESSIDAGLFGDDLDIILPSAGAAGQDAVGVQHPTIPLSDVSDEDLNAACVARLCPACPVKKEAEADRLRALADMENTRKRLAREKEEFQRYAAESVISNLLSALDTFDLALAHAPEDAASKNFVVGVDMTRKLLLDSLGNSGLVQVGVLGETFDPALHEAVSMEVNAAFASGQVCGLVSKGYKLHDRLLRPAKVIVCKNEA